ncbi:Variant-specific surface protein [Giardia duodenalis]|uniref:Variant-specific surface protein n=1 Tax=Giardia intestinalis TaxID=5741 RepID=V6U5L0_GIAIN|nr:Variant-specific surface protein [Giardia intestinalis]
MVTYRNRRVQAGMCAHIPATAHVGPQFEAHRTDSGGLVALAHLSSDMDLHSSLGGCYDARAAPGSGVCREARDGACVGYAEEVRPERAGTGETRNSRAACTPTSGGSAGTCEQCEATIGGTAYCSKCNEPNTYAPVDGVCEDVETKQDKKALCTAHSKGICTQCGSTSFLYKGGCYQPGDGKPGQSLCVLAAKGVCTQAADGYFIPTGAANTDQSVVACDDEAGVAVGGSTYKGIANCQECAAPDAAPGARTDKVATCTRCVDPKYLKGNECVENADACGDGYAAKEDSKNGNRCIKCDDADNGGIADCAQCTATASPTRSGAPLVTCSQCNGKKVQPDRKGCIDTCPDNSSDNSGVCECASGYVPDAAGTGCTQDTAPQCKTPGCKACTNPAEDNEACTECNENKYLTPTNQCVDTCSKLGNYYGADDKTCKECTVANCAECNTDGSCQTCTTGFYPDVKECKACDSSCKSCSGATAEDCTACPAGKALKYGNDNAKGTCGEGCTIGTGSGACKTCDLTVEGTAYCSACSVDTEYPQNGVCAPKTTRTATCSDGSISGGVCNTCSAGYFRMNGGCYETTRYPGKSVCTTVASSGGTCQTAAPGYNVNGGNLVTCPGGCKTCSAADACSDCADGYVKLNNAQTCSKCDASCLTCETEATKCKVCASGYYKSTSGSGACTSCESNSGGITGVRGCASCAPSTGSTGPVLCYLMKDSTTGGNDPNLSSGAIAGISVAVIAVVGDLVDSDRNVGTCIADASDRERCRCAALSAEVGLRRPSVQIRAYASCRRPRNGGSDDMAPVSSNLQRAVCSASRRQDHFVDAE